MSQTPEQRAAALEHLREMVAFLEAHPCVPVPDTGNLYAFSLRSQGTEAERFATLFDIADAFDAPVVEDKDGDRKTERSFGRIDFVVVAQAAGEQRELRRVVTRPTDRPLAAEHGECPDERMRSVA